MTDAKKSTNKDKVRSIFVAAEAGAVCESAEVIFEYAGKEILSDGSKVSLRKLAELMSREGIEGASKTALLETGKSAGKSAGKTVARTACEQGTKAVGKAAARESTKQVFKGVGRAAGLGGVIDGVFGAGEGLYKWSNGELTGGEACIHAAKEAGTGAAASAAGVAATAGLIALTGPVSVPLAAGVAIATSIGAKLGLSSLFD